MELMRNKREPKITAGLYCLIFWLSLNILIDCLCRIYMRYKEIVLRKEKT